MSSEVTPGSKQQITLAATPTHNLFKAALTYCSEECLHASEIE